jgi:hypothetical protein
MSIFSALTEGQGLGTAAMLPLLFCEILLCPALQALDLGRRSDADPRGLLQQLVERGMVQELAVNDLEQPAFDMCDWCPATMRSVLCMSSADDTCSTVRTLLQVCAKHDGRHVGLSWFRHLGQLPLMTAHCSCSMPELGQLKQRLLADSSGCFSAVFMTGSGSTIVCIGSPEPPAFLQEPQYSQLFVRPARLICRTGEGWYQPAA